MSEAKRDTAKISRKETPQDWPKEQKLLPADYKEDFLHILLNQFLQLWAASFVSAGTSPVLHSQNRPDHKLTASHKKYFIATAARAPKFCFILKIKITENCEKQNYSRSHHFEGTLCTIFQVHWLSPEGKCEILVELGRVFLLTVNGIKAVPETAFSFM